MFFSFFSCAKKRTSIGFFLCVKALGIPKGDACRSALPLSQSEATERTSGRKKVRERQKICDICDYLCEFTESRHSSVPAVSPDFQTSRHDPLSLSGPVRHAASSHSPPATSFLPVSSVSMSSGYSQFYNKAQS